MKTCPLQKSDCGQLVDLWNRSARFDPLSVPLLHEKVWGDSDYSDSLGLVLKQDEQSVALALGVIRQVDQKRLAYIKLLAVDPKFQGQGLGRQLVRDLEVRLYRERISSIRLGESAPNYLFPGIDVRYTRAMFLFESLGYQRIGETFNLVAELTGGDFSTQDEEIALAECGIKLRRAAASDFREIEQLLAENWPSWRSEVQVAMDSDPPAVHLALADGRVVGFSAYNSNNLGTAWFGPMGTCPPFRKKGIGQVLLKRCLADMQSQGHARTTIPWVGPVQFYARHVGAQIDRVFYRYEKTTQQSDL